MTDKISIIHSEDNRCDYLQQIIIPDDMLLSGKGVIIYTNYDSGQRIMIPEEIFRKFVAECQRTLSAWDFPK